MSGARELLRVDELKTHFFTKRGVVRAVDGVSFGLRPGEILGVAGESGSGKSATAFSIMGLVGESGCGKSTLGGLMAILDQPASGQLYYKGRKNQDLDRTELKGISFKLQMIFQTPFSSLNPRMRVLDEIGEAALAHGLTSRQAYHEYVEETMRSCGLDPAVKYRYPHQYSGGQKQRIGIARALAVNPELIVCDQAVAALDVSIQAQIINLFSKLREENSLTYLFISHDIGVAEYLSDQVIVIYLGGFVERASCRELFEHTLHPYTQALLN